MERRKKSLNQKITSRSSRNHSKKSSPIKYVVKTIKLRFVEVNKSYPIEAYSQTYQRLQGHEKQDKLRILFTLDPVKYRRNRNAYFNHSERTIKTWPSRGHRSKKWENGGFIYSPWVSFL